MVLNTWVLGTCFIIHIPHETFPCIAVNNSINKLHAPLASAIYLLQIGFANWMEITSSIRRIALSTLYKAMNDMLIL